MSSYYRAFQTSSQSDIPGQSSSWLTSFMGLSSIFGALGILSQSYAGSSVKLLVLGSLFEMGRRLAWWFIERFRFWDPAYEWIVLFITDECVWKRSCDFIVSAKNSQRKWAVKPGTDASSKGHAEYVPTYQVPQLFKWRGHWVEIKRNTDKNAVVVNNVAQNGRIYVTRVLRIYTLDMAVLTELVEEARVRYVETNRPRVVVHLTDSRHYNPRQVWTNIKHKTRRPLSSIILPPGQLDSLVEDAAEFLKSEDWYISSGIPNRRGYLLHGPPGTGKTSTIYALAGALGLEIYSLSLASNTFVLFSHWKKHINISLTRVDDFFLQQAASNIPKNGIFLIEDIDCAFPSRADEDEEFAQSMPLANTRAARAVRPAETLSGLLNVIDGVGSEEGKLFFATTNYMDRLDPALLRPGRIDRKVEYALSSTEQAGALFMRFFPEERFPSKTEKSTVADLAAQFAGAVPPGEFSTAELQGYLQGHKAQPDEAAAGVAEWVEEVRCERSAREVREEERRTKAQARMQKFGQGAAAVAG
ncbi:P-loop containing nucleoside triphosphate hydrolase protein [Mycena rebaudengoi]|nr:P-loop containing nucleoside triphosphate hydrolase protein [Mycena rebaudengoi]